MKTEIGGVIEIRRNHPMVSSLKIAELFERRHDSVLRAIRKVQSSQGGLRTDAQTSDQEGLRIRAETSLDSQGKERPVYWLDEEAALIVMPFIGGKRAMEGQRRLVKAYLHYRDAYANPPRAGLIQAKRDASRLLTDAVIDWRAFEGKDTAARHFMTEQKLCNWTITGQFAALDETELSNDGVELLREIREMNAALIAAGMAYPERKNALARFAIRRRTQRLEKPA